MTNPVVKCAVDTCVHWLPDDACGAGNIDVLDEAAKTSEDTKCKTFQLRSSVANMAGGLDNVNWGGMVREPFGEGRQLTPSVTCTARECTYWASGDRCEADSIDVSGSSANTCEETDCSTFERGS
ncbi:MAG: DUF1540 domain-containing protein [Bacillota bacterium]